MFLEGDGGDVFLCEGGSSYIPVSVRTLKKEEKEEGHRTTVPLTPVISLVDHPRSEID